MLGELHFPSHKHIYLRKTESCRGKTFFKKTKNVEGEGHKMEGKTVRTENEGWNANSFRVS